MSSPALKLFDAESADLRGAVGVTLREAREAFHRRSRFSSPNEALDEVCKLLFAHLVSVSEGGQGIADAVGAAKEPAAALAAYVGHACDEHLPTSLAQEMSSADFALRVKPSEDDLALDLAAAFEHLSPKGAFDIRDLATEADVVNEVFGAFLSTAFVDEKQLGQYLTPPEVVKFIVDLALGALTAEERATLLDPTTAHDFGAILDPSCGVGSFLTLFAQRLYRELKVSDKDRARVWLDVMLASNIVGFDKSERMIRLAVTNLALLGADDVNLHLVNSLARAGTDAATTDTFAGKVGLIMTNPPFGAEFRSTDLNEYRIATEWTSKRPAKVDSEVLFMERYLDWLRPEGRLFAIVPDSILTNRGLFADLREGLRHRAEVELVVSLPPATFEGAGTQTKTSVLQLRKLVEPARSRNSLAYTAICGDIGFSVATRGSHRLKVRNGGGDLPTISAEATGRADGNLGRWIENMGDASRWDATFHASLPREIERTLANPPADALFVRDVAELSSERVNPERGDGDAFRYVEISDVDPATGSVMPKMVARNEAPSRARKLIRAGDVLVSTVRPERRNVVVVPDEADGAICSTGFAVLRPKTIAPHVLASALRTTFATAQILRNNVGIAYPAVDESCLTEIMIPIVKSALPAAEKASSELVRAEDQWKAARAEFDEVMDSHTEAFLSEHQQAQIQH